MNKTLHVSQRGESLSRAVLLAMAAVGPAGAQAATLVGGGATLPAVGYEGSVLALGGTMGTRLANPATTDSASLFGALRVGRSTLGVSYCQVGSTGGKRVLGGVSGYAADNFCGPFDPQLGFGGPVTTPRTLDPNFAASDAPLSQAQYNAVISSWGSRHTAPVQFPVVAGAIGIVYNNSLTALNLSDSQVCQIFSGHISNWSQLSTSAQPIAAAPLTVIYRSNGSGTTFSLSNHLAAVCSLPSGHFITDEFFTPNVLAGITAGGAVPSNFTAANSDSVVMNAVGATANSIGYGEIADAEVHSPVIKHATVNGLDPVNDFASSGTFAITTTTGMVIGGVTPSTGQPVISAISGGAQTQCVVIVDPNTYSVPASGYPIVAISNLLGYYNGNGANTSDLRYVLSGPYDVVIQSNVLYIGSFTGLSWVSDAGHGGNTTAAKVNGCINS